MPAAGLSSLPSLASAAVLASLGFVAMLSTESGQGLKSVWSGAAPEYILLDERDSTLHQRRGVEELLAAFAKGQLARHYWGQFASSLVDLGLTADSSLGFRVEKFRQGDTALADTTPWR